MRGAPRRATHHFRGCGQTHCPRRPGASRRARRDPRAARTWPDAAKRRANASWWSSTASPNLDRRATTIGRFPFASVTATEPTPAWVTTTRAARTCVDSSSNERKSTHSAPDGRTRRRAALDDELLVEVEVVDRRRRRSNGASFVPTVTKITTRTRCPRTGRPALLNELGPLDIDTRRYRSNEATAQRGASILVRLST